MHFILSDKQCQFQKKSDWSLFGILAISYKRKDSVNVNIHI
jgi:hypothetical protein